MFSTASCVNDEEQDPATFAIGAASPAPSDSLDMAELEVFAEHALKHLDQFEGSA